MSNISEIVSSFKIAFAETDYPDEFLKAYDQLECMSSHPGREVFLVRRKDTGALAVAKCYESSAFRIRPSILAEDMPAEPGIPKYLERYENGKMICVVFEYIQGEPLDQYVKTNQPDVNKIADMAKQLCDILERLHTHKPPIIHRDIKPGNVIVRPDGKVYLIDFDVSRIYDEGKDNDTVMFGTRGFAPPEQYGFEQTDCRSDIFSFGILLRWMLTGNIRKNLNVTIHQDLERIIDKCTEYDPKDRYQDISAVRKKLEGIKRYRAPVSFKKALIACGIILILALIGGFTLGRYTNIFEPKQVIVFSEPLIEKAARLQLNKPSGSLTKEELESVKYLYIWGTEAYPNFDEYSANFFSGNKYGTMCTLNDLALLPNLTEVFISCQEYVDVRGLSGLSQLSLVELKHSRISSIDPIANLHQLKQAVLFDLELTDVTALEACPRLEVLDIGYNPIESLGKIGKHPSLKSLGLMWLELDDVSNIEEYLPKLQTLTLQYGRIKDLSGLTGLKNLRTVYVLENQKDYVSSALSGTKAEIVIEQ